MTSATNILVAYGRMAVLLAAGFAVPGFWRLRRIRRAAAADTRLSRWARLETWSVGLLVCVGVVGGVLSLVGTFLNAYGPRPFKGVQTSTGQGDFLYVIAAAPAIAAVLASAVLGTLAARARRGLTPPPSVRLPLSTRIGLFAAGCVVLAFLTGLVSAMAHRLWDETSSAQGCGSHVRQVESPARATFTALLKAE